MLLNSVDLLYTEELYGDFEDLETGEIHSGQSGLLDPAEVSPVYMEISRSHQMLFV